MDEVVLWKGRGLVGDCRRGCGRRSRGGSWKMEGAFVLGDDSKTDGASVLAP